MVKESKESTPRPWPVTAASYSLFVAGIAQLIYSFTGAMAPYGRFYSAIQAFLIVVMIAAVSGVLSMERWGLWLLLAVLATKLGVDVWSGAFHPAALLWMSGFSRMKSAHPFFLLPCTTGATGL
jgi:hypothetical protein